MRKFIYLICIQCLLLAVINATCPSPIPALPKLPVPAVVPPPVAPCPGIPTPAQISGYLPFTFVNDSGLSADDIYVAVLVNSSTQYLSFNGSSEATITAFTPSTYLSSTSSPQYSYPLSFFSTNAGANTYTFYIPNDGNSGISGSNVMKSSRILISLQQPLTYFINNLGVLQLPAEFDVTNDNYYVLNDKIEFDLGSNALNRLNLNLTGVDFFGLPLLVRANYQFFFGSSYTDACAITGMPSGVGLANVFNGYNTSLNSLAAPFNTYWGGLVATYTNPPAAGSTVCNLRIYAPATAMGSSQTQSNPSSVTFPTDYFLSSALPSNPGCSWFNAVWSGKTQSGAKAYYQQTNPTPYLVLDATTVNGSATAKGREASDGSFRFTISGGPDNGNSVIFPLPTSSKAFFTGAISDYAPAISGTASATTQAQILKVFATSIISGFFPLNCQGPEPFTITNTYLQDNSWDFFSSSSNYFNNNSQLGALLSGCSCVANNPWYDFYSRTLLTIGTPNVFYTSAYSDFLGTDGTIVIVNPNTNNDNATIIVNFNNLSTGVNFPNPYADTTSYNATVNPPGNATVLIGTSASGPFTALPNNPFPVNGNNFYLQVTYNTGSYSGLSFVTQIAPSIQVFHPVLPGQGVITTSGTNTTVALGASPP